MYHELILNFYAHIKIMTIPDEYEMEWCGRKFTMAKKNCKSQYVLMLIYKYIWKFGIFVLSYKYLESAAVVCKIHHEVCTTYNRLIHILAKMDLLRIPN